MSKIISTILILSYSQPTMALPIGGDEVNVPTAPGGTYCYADSHKAIVCVTLSTIV